MRIEESKKGLVVQIWKEGNEQVVASLIDIKDASWRSKVYRSTKYYDRNKETKIQGSVVFSM